jgi:hypothetical protein
MGPPRSKSPARLKVGFQPDLAGLTRNFKFDNFAGMKHFTIKL